MAHPIWNVTCYTLSTPYCECQHPPPYLFIIHNTLHAPLLCSPIYLICHHLSSYHYLDSTGSSLLPIMPPHTSGKTPTLPISPNPNSILFCTINQLTACLIAMESHLNTHLSVMETTIATVQTTLNETHKHLAMSIVMINTNHSLTHETLLQDLLISQTILKDVEEDVGLLVDTMPDASAPNKGISTPKSSLFSLYLASPSLHNLATPLLTPTAPLILLLDPNPSPHNHHTLKTKSTAALSNPTHPPTPFKHGPLKATWHPNPNNLLISLDRSDLKLNMWTSIANTLVP